MPAVRRSARRPARVPAVPLAVAQLAVALLAVALLAVALLAGTAACSGPAHPTGTAAPASGTPSTVPSARPPASAGGQGAAGCVAATLATLSLEQQVAQLVMIGTPVQDPASAVDAVRRYHVGGVFLNGRSSAPAATLRTAIAALQQASTGSGGLGLQIALDQEGGQVQTLSGPDFPTIPSAVDQGRLGSATLGTQTAAWAARLAGIGVTLDLAPVADTVPAGTAAQNPPIGALDRQYGSDPATVARAIQTVVAAAQAAGVMTTLKHFPGLGRVRTNTDFGTGAVDATATVTDPYLGPFTAGIQAGTGAVMVSLASYPTLDPQAIAAFSEPIVTGLLRQRLGFTGLVVSDDLGAAAAVGNLPIGERAVRFVTAGGDLALSVRTADAGPMTAALLARARSSAPFAARVAASAAKVLASKYQQHVLTCTP